MPLYDYECDICGVVREVLGKAPLCCGEEMRKLPSYPAMVKIKGSGGYPSRRKMISDTAPYCGGR